MAGHGLKYKIRLKSGRILGPLDLERIRSLIAKNKIVGDESARQHPDGDWVHIGELAPIVDLLVAHAQDRLKTRAGGETQLQNLTRPYVVPGTTRMLAPGTPSKPDLPIPDLTARSGEVAELKHANEATRARRRRRAKEKKTRVTAAAAVAVPIDDDKTSVGDLTEIRAAAPLDHEGRAVAAAGLRLPAAMGGGRLPVPSAGSDQWPDSPRASVANQPTLMMENPFNARQVNLQDAAKDPRKAKLALKNAADRKKKQVFGVLSTLAMLYIIYELLGSTTPTPDPKEKSFIALRPALPAFSKVAPDPGKSALLFSDAMRDYVKDTVVGYMTAAEKFRLAAQADIGNVKALALLASCYLNLIDSSNKDENYFNVITKLIELSGQKDVDLPETVIADVEFYLTINKAEAAENRIVQYTNNHSHFGAEMFYYLSLAFYHRGDFRRAANFIAQFPENRVFSPKVYYLRGQIAESFDDTAAAIREYEKAIRFYAEHSRSRLAIARIYAQRNRLQDAAPQLELAVKNPRLLSPMDLASAYFLRAQLKESQGQNDVALTDMEKAIRLEPNNHQYLFEAYSLRARTGGDIDKLKPNARMYFYLSEGEKLLRDGNPQDALTQFLQARQANSESPLPLVKIGDMFYRQHDYVNARANYKKAASLAPNNVEVWSKYIDVMIQSYEWDEARQAMDRFRKMPVNQSAVDKAAADMYAKQGMFEEADQFYKKAMGRDSIDPGVYFAYAKSLLATRNYKEAPFYFALALRLDPLNVEALIGTAYCVAATEGIDRAISLLEDELQKGNRSRSELLSSVAEFLMKKGAYAQAQSYISQAMTANPDYALPWSLQAQLYASRENTEKGAMEKALDAYNSYSDRNASDPSGYLERYRIFVKKGEFERASDELGKVYAVYPKFPNLHYYKGVLYSMMGNRKAAVEEFKVELANNPNNASTLLAYGRELIRPDVNQPAEALSLFNKAMQLSPKSADAKLESGYANYLLKNYQGAIALYLTALGLDKGNPMIYKRLGQAYKDLGDMANAQKYLREYLRVEPDAPDRQAILRFLR